MAEDLFIPKTENRAIIYESLLPQLEALVEPEPSLMANLANIAAAVKQFLDFLWVGFYLVDGEELVLGPFQGPVACTRIAYGKGVCGTAWKSGRTMVVPDVNEFPGHIACSALSASEIVVPILKAEEVVALIDVDSSRKADFAESDQSFFEDLARLCASLFVRAEERHRI